MVNNIPGALIPKYSETRHYTVILSYLVGPTILICNLDVLENATLSVLSGEGLREGRSSNLLRQLIPFLFFLQSNKITTPIWNARVLTSFRLE